MKIQIDHMMGTATFAVNIETSASKETLKGMFKVKCILSPMQYIQSDSLYRELLGKTNPQFANDYVGNLCYALSQLKYRIIEAPEWFGSDESGVRGSSVEDNVLLHILDRSVEAEDTYRKAMEEKYESAKKAVKDAFDKDELDTGLDDLEEEDE